jgi:ribosomal protein L27
MGKDYTLYALVAGTVKFTEKRREKFDGRRAKDSIVHVMAA